MTLPTKVYVDSQLNLVDKYLKNMLKGLQVEVSNCEVTSHRLVQVRVSGEDEKAALRYLADEVGLCPTSLGELRKFSELRGRIMAFERGKEQLRVDIGVSSVATISLQQLQAQLVDGSEETFGPGVPDERDAPEIEHLPLDPFCPPDHGGDGMHRGIFFVSHAHPGAEITSRRIMGKVVKHLDRVVDLGGRGGREAAS